MNILGSQLWIIMASSLCHSLQVEECESTTKPCHAEFVVRLMIISLLIITGKARQAQPDIISNP